MDEDSWSLDSFHGPHVRTFVLSATPQGLVFAEQKQMPDVPHGWLQRSSTPSQVLPLPPSAQEALDLRQIWWKAAPATPV